MDSGEPPGFYNMQRKFLVPHFIDSLAVRWPGHGEAVPRFVAFVFVDNEEFPAELVEVLVLAQLRLLSAGWLL